MSKLSKNILKKIEKGEILPKPRWHFILKNLAIWSGALILLVLGILATMLIFYFLMNLELLGLVLEMPEIFPKIILLGLPGIWISFMFALSFLAGVSMQKTERGYKWSFLTILIGIILIQIAVGGVLAHTSFAEKVEKTLQRNIGTRSLEERKARIWDIPENGLLSGEIINIELDQWNIRNRRGDEWEIIIEGRTELPPNMDIKKGDLIRARGEVLDETEKIFQAEKIFPMKGRQRDFHKLLQKQFPHLSPDERNKIQKRIEKEGPPPFRKMLETLPEEERMEILNKLKKMDHAEVRDFLYKLRKNKKGRRDENQLHHWQQKKIENKNRMNDTY